MPSITLKFKDSIIGRYPVPAAKSLTIGRRKDNDIVIDNLAVSGRHAKIDAVGESFVLVDLQSRNGSFVNEQLVGSHWLRHGDVISIGKHVLVFSIHDGGGTAPKEPTGSDRTMLMDTSSYRSMVQKSAPVLPKPLLRTAEAVGYLAYLSGGHGRVELTRKLVTLGRDPESDVVIKGLLVAPTAATISRRSDGYHLSCTGGWVKPKINDLAVMKSVLLQDLDVIAIGSVKLQFFASNSSPTCGS